MTSEKEKMLSGDLYKAFGEELLKERQFAKEQIHLYNTLHPDQLAERKQILKKLLGNQGNNIWIEPPFRCDYGYNISVGNNFYSNYNLTVLDCAKVTIGNNVLIGPNVGLYAAGHPIDPTLRNSELEYAFPITIGNNVWIGGHVSINPGITIGDNVVIGSGSVITKDIPDNMIAAGNPCKIIRPLNEKDKVYYFKDRRIME